MMAPHRQPTPRESIVTRQVGWPLVVAAVALTIAILTAFLLLRRAGPLASWVLAPWLENCFTFATLLLFVVGGLLLGIARLRPSQLGLVAERLPQAIVVVGAIWVIGQCIGSVESLATNGSIRIHPMWSSSGSGPALIWAAVMLFGAAMFEEIVYRGFLFPQLALKFRGSESARFWSAVVASQAVFAAAHIPGHIVLRHLSGVALMTQLGLQMLAGIVLLLLYLRTRNLWIAIGLHGLVNAPILVVSAAWPPEMFIPVVLLAWPWLTRRHEHRGLASIEDVSASAALDRLSGSTKNAPGKAGADVAPTTSQAYNDGVPAPIT